jgi:anti-anti-sigma factor
MKIEETERGSVRLVRLEGRLDATNAPEIERRLGEIIGGGATRVVLDCSALEYISSAGLRVFLSVAKRLMAAQGRLALGGPLPQVREILEIAGFTSVMQVAQTVEDAIAACAS